jgi:hypothetical protein
MGRIIGGVLTVVLVVAFLVTAYGFGFLGWEQVAYVGELIVGWTAYTIVIALLYAGLEKLFPNVLCAAAHEDANPRAQP